VGDFERSLVKRPLFSQAGLNSLYTVEPTGSSVYLSAQVCAKGICWYNYITYFFVLLVSNKKGGLAIPLQLAEVGVSSPINDEQNMKKEVHIMKKGRVFIFLVAIFAVLACSSALFGADAPLGNLFIVFSVEHFAGVEVRTNIDAYSNLYAAFGVNGMVFGLRVSSKETRGLYISPKVCVNYQARTLLNLMIGWKTIVTNLSNGEFFVEAGVKDVLGNLVPDVNIGFALKF